MRNHWGRVKCEVRTFLMDTFSDWIHDAMARGLGQNPVEMKGKSETSLYKHDGENMQTMEVQ